MMYDVPMYKYNVNEKQHFTYTHLLRVVRFPKILIVRAFSYNPIEDHLRISFFFIQKIFILFLKKKRFSSM